MDDSRLSDASARGQGLSIVSLLNEVGLESQFADARRRGLFGSEQTRYTFGLTLEPVIYR
ncbi:hypothetical protein D3C79_771230 [compost metagenome]